MKVAVIELRDDKGRKRPRAAVLADQPVYGFLLFGPGCCYVQGRDDSPPTVGAILPALVDARVRLIRKGSMVIVGGYIDPSASNINAPRLPQAWWVRPVGHGGISAS